MVADVSHLTYRVTHIDPFSDRRWDPFVRRDPAGSFYHSAAWQHILRQSFHFESLHLAAEDESGDLVAILPLFLVNSALTGKKLVSLPFSDVAGPLGQYDGAVKLLLEHATRLQGAYGAKYLQIRSLRDDLESIVPQLARDQRYVEYVVSLSQTAEALWANPALAKVRGHIRKARKSGITVRLGSSEDDLRAFHRLHLATTKKHGMPAQAFSYFRNLWHELDGACQRRLLMAVDGGRVVAASLFVGFGDSVHYVYNASDRSSLHLGPNDLLLWDAMEWGCREGYRSFSFGKTSLANAGLVAFKRGWGAQEVPMYYYYFPRIDGLTSTAYAEDSQKYRLMTSLWRILPSQLTGVVGGALYKHLA